MSATLEEVQRKLHAAFHERDPSVDEMKAILESYRSNPKDWKKYVTWSDVRYTRNLVDKGNDRFNLIILCWSESQGSAIHDHSNSHCMVKVLEGNLQETLFKMPSESEGEGTEMEQTHQAVYGKDQVTYIHDNQGVVHRMENPSHTEGTVSLHLYTPPFNMCYTFDDNTSHRKEAMITFDTEDGHPVDKGVNQCASSTCCGK